MAIYYDAGIDKRFFKKLMKVLVLMATYNGARFIEAQIHSILNQTGLEVALLISDDNSSDNTSAVIESFIQQGMPVKLIRRAHGSGSAAKNFMSLIRLVENPDDFDAFAFSDQDDIWMADKLSTALKRLAGTGSDLYASNLIRWDQDTDTKGIIKKDQPQKAFDYLFEGGSAGCTYVFTKMLFEKISASIPLLNFDSWIGFSHDWLVYFIARLNGLQVFIDPEPKILYRIHDSNVHGHLNTFSLSSLNERFELVRHGWYMHQINGFMPLLTPGSKAYEIYELYQKNWASRVYIIFKYNFSLLRSQVKLFQFALLSMIPQKKQNTSGI
jgi:rhamnosyltransferase